MSPTLKTLDSDNKKFAPTEMYFRDDAEFSASGKGVIVDGEMWPVSQLRAGEKTVFGARIYVAKWLLIDRSRQANASTSAAYAQLATMATRNKTSL